MIIYITTELGQIIEFENGMDTLEYSGPDSELVNRDYSTTHTSGIITSAEYANTHPTTINGAAVVCTSGWYNISSEDKTVSLTRYKPSPTKIRRLRLLL